MPLPLSVPVLINELETANAILVKWKDTLEKGLPDEGYPGGAEALSAIALELAGELQLVAGKCDTMSDVIRNLAL